jgi:uncharacterized protein YvpB
MIFNGILTQKVEAEEISNPVISNTYTSNVVEQGRITIKNYDAVTKLPIANTKYNIIDATTKKVVEVLSTNDKGMAESKLYDYGTKYIIKQSAIMLYFELDNKEILVEIKDQNLEITTTNRVKQGRITIKNNDAVTKHSIKNTQYSLIDSKSNKVVEVLTTNEKGIAVSKLYNFGTNYKIKQTKIMMPFEVNSKELPAQIKNTNIDIFTTNHVLAFIKKYQFLANGTIDIKQVNIPVKTLMQKPELPNGCEITSLTAVLNYYHFNITKTKMSDVYLPKQPFSWKRHRLFGPDPNLAFSGNPRSRSGFFTYAPPIVTAANNYFKVVKGKYHGVNLTGNKKEAIIEQLKKGNPVVIWITLSLQKPKITYGWYLFSTNKYFAAPVNLHAVVLTGYDENKLFVMDPLRGQVTYDKNMFFNSYVSLGSRAMVVVPN